MPVASTLSCHHTALRLYGVTCTACVQPLRGEECRCHNVQSIGLVLSVAVYSIGRIMLSMMALSLYTPTTASTGTVLSISPMRVSEAWRLTPV